MDEIWKAIPGYETTYAVSSLGRVRRVIDPPAFIDGAIDRDDYKRVSLRKDGGRRQFGVHRLVYLAFKGQLEQGKEVAHLDGNPANNAVSNLALVLPVENTRHKRLHGTHQAGEQHPRARLSSADVDSIRSKLASGIATSAIAEEYAITPDYVRDIRSGRRWRSPASAVAEGQTPEQRAAELVFGNSADPTYFVEGSSYLVTPEGLIAALRAARIDALREAAAIARDYDEDHANRAVMRNTALTIFERIRALQDAPAQNKGG